MPERIQLRRAKGWRLPPGAILVDRRTDFGNPWKPGDPGRLIVAGTEFRLDRPLSAEQTVAFFERWLDGCHLFHTGRLRGALPPSVRGGARDRLAFALYEQRNTLLARLPDLAGRDLACWCRLCDAHAAGKPFALSCPACPPCHGDVLGARANAEPA